MRSNKSVAVLAHSPDDRATFIGSIIYKCGLNLELHDELQRHGVSHYIQIPAFLEAKGIPLVFETRSSDCTITANVATAAVVVIVLNAATHTRTSIDFLDSTNSSVPKSAMVMVLIDKFEKVDRSAPSPTAFLPAIAEWLHESEWSKERIKIIPVSAARGDNILEPTEDTRWHSRDHEVLAGLLAQETFVQAFDV